MNGRENMKAVAPVPVFKSNIKAHIKINNATIFDQVNVIANFITDNITKLLLLKR